MVIKIGFVGPQESTWILLGALRNSKVEVQAQVYRILKSHAKVTRTYDHGSYIEEYDYSDIVFVSGHCPKGGVDVWAEEIADQLGIKKEIYFAEVNQWEDKGFVASNNWVGEQDIELKGYRSRNIEIAVACTILYCIVPRLTGRYSCVHCGRDNHPTNGGCWTRKYANKIGKETHLVLIE